MENIINKIIEIDENARRRLEEACQKKSEILCDAEKQEVAIRNDVLQRVKGRVEKIEEFEKTNADEKLEELNKKKEEAISYLNTIYNDNHEQWEKEIYNNILNLN